MHLTVKGLVLRLTPYKDTDAILTLLTADQGKLTVKARNLRRKNSSLTAPCQLLAYGEFTLFEYRGMYTVNDAHSIELFQGLRRDILRLSLGTYFAQVADVISQEDAPSGELLSLVLNSLYAVSQTDLSMDQIKGAFELRCACIAGYTPDLSGCYHCGAAEGLVLDISQGILECSGCKNVQSSGIRVPLSAGVFDAMRYICTCPAKRLHAFSAGEDTLISLSQVAESYLCTQLERGFSALDFYKTLLATQ